MLFRIPLCFICDEKYVMPTAVAITSVIVNRNSDNLYDIYVVTNNLSNESIKKLKIMETESVRIIIINADKDKRFNKFKIENLHVTPSAIIKFELPDLLPEELEKVLYLDGDIIVQKDLALILNENIENVYAGVVSDGPISAKVFSDRKQYNVKRSSYFNTGVLLLNLKKMREEHISELLLECKFRNYHADRFMDQDTFNAVLGEKVKYLSFYYNFQYHVWVYDKKALAEHYGMKVIKYEWIKEAFIIHYTWRKPWDYYGYFAADIWLNHYLLSPFKDVTLHRILLNEVNEYDKYETARIDIKNFGTEDNSVTIEQCSDEAIQVESPVWLKDSQGTGLVIHSVEGKMELETRSIGAGNVRIQVRGKSCLDNDGKRYPVWIYVTCLRVDGKELFTSPHFVCYNKPFVHNLNVKDGQIVKIYIEWRSAVDILAKHFEKGEAETAKKLVMVQKKIAQLERSKANIEKELKNVKNGWSFRIGRVITWLPRKLR